MLKEIQVIRRLPHSRLHHLRPVVFFFVCFQMIQTQFSQIKCIVRGVVGVCLKQKEVVDSNQVLGQFLAAGYNSID